MNVFVLSRVSGNRVVGILIFGKDDYITIIIIPNMIATTKIRTMPLAGIWRGWLLLDKESRTV